MSLVLRLSLLSVVCFDIDDDEDEVKIDFKYGDYTFLNKFDIGEIEEAEVEVEIDVEVVVGDIGVVFIAPLEIVLLLKFELEIEDVVISDVLLVFSRVLILDLLEIEEEEKGFY